MHCPYDGCPFEGTQDEVDDHVAYVTGLVDDPDHTEDKRQR